MEWVLVVAGLTALGLAKSVLALDCCVRSETIVCVNAVVPVKQVFVFCFVICERTSSFKGVFYRGRFLPRASSFKGASFNGFVPRSCTGPLLLRQAFVRTTFSPVRYRYINIDNPRAATLITCFPDLLGLIVPATSLSIPCTSDHQNSWIAAR